MIKFQYIDSIKQENFIGSGKGRIAFKLNDYTDRIIKIAYNKWGALENQADLGLVNKDFFVSIYEGGPLYLIEEYVTPSHKNYLVKDFLAKYCVDADGEQYGFNLGGKPKLYDMNFCGFDFSSPRFGIESTDRLREYLQMPNITITKIPVFFSDWILNNQEVELNERGTK